MGDIQRAVLAAGFDPRGIDENFGRNTAAAVASFQQAQGLPNPGIVDDGTWQALMQKPVPGRDVRSLELTAAFEGHGYSLAQGNWDGAWLTWGIIGFTLKHGEVQKIILSIQANAPQLISQSFGDKATDLVQTLQASPRRQEQWAISVSVGSRLVEPWRTGFDMLGRFPEVREEQRRLAYRDYFLPSLDTAKHLDLQSELGMALCFDIHVQDGGIGSAARSLIQKALDTEPAATEQDLRRVVANAVADTARQSFREDVRQRKLTIANGEGDVHGTHYVLENWGLSEAPAAELS